MKNLCVVALALSGLCACNNNIPTTLTDAPDDSGSPPVADALVAETAVAGDSVSFDASQSGDADGLVVGYFWDFGDSSDDHTSNALIASHSYPAAGIYQWSLQVLDDSGLLSESLTGSITITGELPATQPNRAPQAGFYTSQSTARVGEPFTVSNSSSDSDGQIASSRWFVDSDGAGYRLLSEEHNFSYTPLNAGTVRFYLVVTDEDGLDSEAAYGQYTVSAQQSSPPIVAANGRRLFLLGNSITDGANQPALAEMSSAAGKDHHWGRYLIYGATLDYIWNHPYEGVSRGDQSYGAYQQALGNYSWDAISLQPFGSHFSADLNAAKAFMGLALQRNPQAQFYIMAHYPVWRSWEQAGAYDWETQWLGDSSVNTSYAYFRSLAAQLSQAFPAAPAVQLFPAGEVMYRLKQRIDAGQVAGYSDITALYKDSVHLNSAGSYVFACIMYAMLYRQSPLGLPYNSFNVSYDYARLVQTLSWEVAQEQLR